MKLRLLRNISIIVAFIVISFGFGFRVGTKYNNNKIYTKTVNIESKEPPSNLSSVDFSLFWDVWERLRRRYIEKEALDPQKMVYGAISGMVSSLGDPYTVFLPPEKNKDAKNDLGGKFEGIGAQLGIKEKRIVVVAPLKGAPAESAGIKAGDWIVKVDGEETLNWTLPEAVSKIRGQKGSEVVLTVIHKDASKSADITVKRDTIKIASVEWEPKFYKCSSQEDQVSSEEKKSNETKSADQESDVSCKIIKDTCSDCKEIAYLKLGRFGDETTTDWNKSVSEILKYINKKSLRNVSGLVLDLRNNPGGYLSGSVFIASEFLKDVPIVIQEYANGKRETFNVEREGRLIFIPMVVLINKGSASASEIVAGALMSHGRAKLVGEKSFGKGSIQEAQELPGGSGIHITTAKWLMPNGEWINDKGIEPDIVVENGEEDRDLQLEKAIELLTPF